VLAFATIMLDKCAVVLAFATVLRVISTILGAISTTFGLFGFANAGFARN
jgi:hypothetical protein